MALAVAGTPVSCSIALFYQLSSVSSLLLTVGMGTLHALADEEYTHYNLHKLDVVKELCGKIRQKDLSAFHPSEHNGYTHYFERLAGVGIIPRGAFAPTQRFYEQSPSQQKSSRAQWEQFCQEKLVPYLPF
ncbi:MAG: hypothetical protein H0X51_02355 [Parachlamydiaceae bacterium]|nr:hypothetical protein [Parachlamydiaceae bacterium]